MLGTIAVASAQGKVGWELCAVHSCVNCWQWSEFEEVKRVWRNINMQIMLSLRPVLSSMSFVLQVPFQTVQGPIQASAFT